MTALLSPHRSQLALIADATRAPSSHNTQPWLFRSAPGRIELHADRTRALPVNDPLDRELVLSCGAALANLCAAARHHHLTPTVRLRPFADDPDHLADVDLVPAPSYSDDRLAYGIRLRGTCREEMTGRPVPDHVVGELLAATAADGVWAHRLTAAQQPALVDLVRRGDELQFDDPRWRRELAAWMHPRRRGDGLTVPELTAPMTRFVVSHVDLGERTARTDAIATETAPLLVVLGTDADDEASWLAAGQALQRLLLAGAVVGVQAGFSNQPCQVAELRPELAELVGRPNPQVVLRLGYPPEQPTPTVRRPLDEVLLPPDAA
jgi:nitroreductase